MAKKLSIDLTDENAAILESIKNKERKAYGQSINYVIDLFYNLPSDINSEILNFIKNQLRDLYNEMDKAGQYEFQTIMNKSQAYQELAVFFNQGRTLNIDAINSEPKMKKIPMMNSVLVCPDDYIIVNEEYAKLCGFATVVEVRNSAFHVPHFLYFSPKDIHEYHDGDYNEINALCAKKWPKFKEIVESEVEPIFDPDYGVTRLLNKEEYDKAPQIGYFGVYIHGDERLPKNYKPPMGTQIIRI